MRRALEIAWLSAYRFAKRPPTFAGLDDVVFRKPVEVGRLVEYIGRVVYAAEDGVASIVDAGAGGGDGDGGDGASGDGAGGDGAGGDHETTSTTSLRVCVEAHKVNLATGEREPTNEFHFIFRVPCEQGASTPVPIPQTYEEGMLYLEGRRRWQNEASSQ